MILRSLLGFMLALMLAASPVAAQMQMQGSEGEQFLAALKEGDSAKALDLVNKPGSTVVNYRGGNGDAALHIAMRNRDGAWLGFLLSRGADPNIAGRDGDTPLILAARLGYTEGAARILTRRPQVDKANRLGETALIVAVQQRATAIVKMLLEAGADPDKADHAGGYTARDYAKRDSRSTETLKLIETVKSKKASVVGPVRP